jgi:predicted Zn-dependent protease with MMP-like domain
VNVISPAEFEELVVEALDGLPPEMAQHFRNVAVVVEDENPDDPRLLGLYQGIPLTRRAQYFGVLPDRISLYRVPLCLMAADLEDLVREIRITVVHEFGHHMGLPEQRLHELGWG